MASGTEITGTVVGVGQQKFYDNANAERFFMAVVDDAGVEHKAMVTAVVYPLYGRSQPHDLGRKRPFVGDKVRYTCQKEKGGWASVTERREYEIVEDAGKQAWVAKKEAEKAAKEAAWEAEREAKQAARAAERKAAKEQAKATEAANSEGLPEAARAVWDGKLLNTNNIRNVLREAYWLGPIGEGSGGQRCPHFPPCGCGTPGTGMRRPGGALYEMPESHRSKVLRVMTEGGLITNNGKGYVATPEGAAALAEMDTCPDCGGRKEAYKTYSAYNARTYVMESHGIAYFCPCKLAEYRERVKGFAGSNVSSGIANEPNTPRYPNGYAPGCDRPDDQWPAWDSENNCYV